MSKKDIKRRLFVMGEKLYKEMRKIIFRYFHISNEFLSNWSQSIKQGVE